MSDHESPTYRDVQDGIERGLKNADDPITQPDLDDPTLPSNAPNLDVDNSATVREIQDRIEDRLEEIDDAARNRTNERPLRDRDVASNAPDVSTMDED